MSSVRAALPFILALTFTGSSSAGAAPDVKDTRPRIVVFGDSLSAGFGADPGQSFPDYLQKDLDRLGYHYRVVNQGVSGDTTTGGLTRIEEAVREKPAVVILELGGNDGLRGVPLDSTKANLEHIIERLQKARCKVLLAGMTLPPNYGPEYIQQFQAIYRDLARTHRLPLIPFLLADIEFQSRKLGLIQADGIHPTAKGNEIVARTVLKKLTPMLKK